MSSSGRERPIPFRAAMTPPRPYRRALGYGAAVAGPAIVVLSFHPVRDWISPLTIGFTFLVAVVVAAGIGGLGPGVAAAVLGFVTFNFFFLPPFDTFRVARPEYVVVLFVFLGLSVVISLLLSRARHRAEQAEAREAEIRTLYELSRDLVERVPGPEAYEAVLLRLADEFGFSAAALHVQEETAFRGLREQVSVGEGADALSVHWDPTQTGRPPERLPLTVGGRTLGLVVLGGDRPPLSPAESTVLRSFCDQFALVLERDRLLRTATESEVYRQSDDLRRSMLAAVSHDLRSPLAAVKASVTDLLSEDASHDPANLRVTLEAIASETARLEELITNLLDISRLEVGVLKARRDLVELPEALSSALDHLRLRWPRVDVDVHVAPEATPVRADPSYVGRVLVNLLENAAAASAETGANRVEVRATARDGRTTVRVIDHGPGLAAAAREQLFYPFFRLEDRGSRLGGGLGLAICKGFLSLMHGEIWVEDTNGGGATFAFTLPLDASIRS